MGIKVLALQTHYQKDRTHGVDFARIVNPAQVLAKHKDFDVQIRKDPGGADDQTWDDIAKEFDLIFSSYIDSPWGYVHLAMNCRKYNKPFVIDIDDNLWEIPRHSPTYSHYSPQSKKLEIVSNALEDAPYITTTNSYLKNKLAKFLNKDHKRITVLPNYIDLSVYDYHKIPERKSKTITITYYGTNTHTKDVLEPAFINAIEQICSEYPNVQFKTTGFFLPQLKTKLKSQYTFNIGKRDFYDWLNLWGELMADTDIVVAPLESTDFNRSKSNIKFLEYSAAKRPGVYQDIRQYSEMVGHYTGKTRGFLATRQEDWYKHLKALVASETLRHEVGENAYEFVKEKHTMQGHVEDYAAYFKDIVATHNLKESGFITTP